MSYGGRSSRGGGQSQMQQQTFSFPLLSAQEILSTWEDVPLQAKDLDKPTAASVRAVYETLCEQCIGPFVREEIYNPVESAMSRIEFPQLHEESLQQLTFFRYVNRLLLAAGVHDFCLADILKPDPKRFRRNLCAIINFQKFRLQSLEQFEDIHAEIQQLVDSHAGIQDEMADTQDQIDSIRRQRAEEQERAHSLESECKALKSEINVFNDEKERLESESRQLKVKQEELKDYANTLKFQKHSIEQECARMEGNIVRSPERLKSELATQRRQLKQEQSENANLAKALAELRAKDASLSKAQGKSKGVLELLKQVEAAMMDCKKAAKETKKMSASVRDHGDALRQLQTRKVEADRQLELSKERLERLSKTQSLKVAAALHALNEGNSERNALRAQRDGLVAKIEEDKEQITILEERSKSQQKRFTEEMDKRRHALRRLDNVADRSSEMLLERLSYH